MELFHLELFYRLINTIRLNRKAMNLQAPIQMNSYEFVIISIIFF